MNKKKTRWPAALIHLALVVVLLSITGSTQAFQPQNARVASVVAIQVHYKLDKRLTRGIFMGDRWVSPRLYDIVNPNGKSYTLEARVEGISDNGQTELTDAQWVAEDSEMLTISPGQDKQVMIRINRAGESSLQVSAQGITETLYVEAAKVYCGLRLRVSRHEPQVKLTQVGQCYYMHLPLTVN